MLLENDLTLKHEVTAMADPFLKICGIQTIAEAELAADSGATAIGCLVGLTHLAEDKVDVATATRIYAAVAGRLRTVLVTHTTNGDKIVELARATRASAIQLHGDCSIVTAKKVRRELPDAFLIKAIHVTGREALARAEKWNDVPINALLLDSRTTDRLGGTGRTHDWSISAEITAQSGLPVVLAGGLKPENVAEAVRAVRPWGVDVNSGVENKDGSKSPERVRAFLDGARAALAQLPAKAV